MKWVLILLFWATPVFAFAATGPIATFTKTGNGTDSDLCALNSVVSVLGASGDATIKLTGTAPWTYQIVASGTAYITGNSYAVDITACGASSDGTIRVDTVVTPPAVPLGGATSTLEQAETNLAYGFLIALASMFGMVWLLRKH